VRVETLSHVLVAYCIVFVVRIMNFCVTLLFFFLYSVSIVVASSRNPRLATLSHRNKRANKPIPRSGGSTIPSESGVDGSDFEKRVRSISEGLSESLDTNVYTPPDIFSNSMQQSSFGREPTQPSSQQQYPLRREAGTASICVLFGLLVWRSLSAYDLIDQLSPGVFKLFSVVAVVSILIANITGLIVNIMRPLNFKNGLKLVLAMNVLREWSELVYNIFMLIFSSSTAELPKDAFIGRIFMNVWWSLLCFSFSKSRWVLQV
jgi:hypothetical protein